jgi:hypothetical protein
MKTIPAKQHNPQGLHKRYEVKRLPDPDEPHRDSDDKAVYFVLRVDHDGDDRDHIRACWAAALEFARRTRNRQMADDLRLLVAYHTGMLAAREVAEEIE